MHHGERVNSLRVYGAVVVHTSEEVWHCLDPDRHL